MNRSDKYLLTFCILFGLLVFSVFFSIEFGHLEGKFDKNKDAEETLNDFIKERVYYVGEARKDFDFINYSDIALIDNLNKNDFILFDASMINDVEISFPSLVEEHTLLFIGEDVDPLKVHGEFEELSVEFVPLEAPRKIYYQMYGFTYNEIDERYMPVFFASTDQESLSEEEIIQEIQKIVSKFHKKKNASSS